MNDSQRRILELRSDHTRRRRTGGFHPRAVGRGHAQSELCWRPYSRALARFTCKCKMYSTKFRMAVVIRQKPCKTRFLVCEGYNFATSSVRSYAPIYIIMPAVESQRANVFFIGKFHSAVGIDRIVSRDGDAVQLAMWKSFRPFTGFMMTDRASPPTASRCASVI